MISDAPSSGNKISYELFEQFRYPIRNFLWALQTVLLPVKEYIMSRLNGFVTRLEFFLSCLNGLATRSESFMSHSNGFVTVRNVLQAVQTVKLPVQNFFLGHLKG